MENNQEVVLTDNTENVEEQTTEEIVQEEDTQKESVKTYSQEEVDDIIKKRLDRQAKKINKEYSKKYSKAENVLKAGLEVDSFDEAVTKLEEFYKNKGISIPQAQAEYDERDTEYLAEKDANEVKELGINDVIEEVDRLAKVGVKNMTEREKLTFQKLAEYRKDYEARKELASIGVTDEVLNSAEYVEFKTNLNPNMSEKDKYEMFMKYKPKSNVEPIGSVKGISQDSKKVKEYYTREEALKFTRKDFDNNPELFKAVEKSMQKW